MRSSGWDILTESTLVDLARIGSPDAFDELVARYRQAAVSQARQIVRHREMAEDVAQDALITAYKALPQLEDSSRFGAWVGAIVRHQASRTSSAREEQAVQLDDLLLQKMPALKTPSSLISSVECEISRLEPDLRVVAELYYLEEWSVRQIGEFLGLPNTTVKWRLHESRRFLRPRLAESLEITL
jgi:RNA polymerase sigma-70 factor (ECF subfamily)